MYGKYLLGGTALVGVVAWGVWWAQTPHASGPGAQALQTQIQAALGPAGPAVVVTPAFDHYVLKIDLARVLPAKTDAAPVPFAISAYELDLMPLGEGQWQVSSAPQDVTMQTNMVIPGQPEGAVTDYVFKGVTFNGTYDETLRFMRGWQTAYASVNMRQVQTLVSPRGQTNKMEVTAVLSDYRAQTQVSEGPNGLDLTGQARVGSLSESFAMPSRSFGEPVPVVLEMAGLSGTTHIEGLRWNTLLPVLNKLQALYAEGKDLESEQQALAALMLPALPVLDQAATKADFSTLSLKVQDTSVKADSGTFEVEFSTAGEGLREAFEVTGVSVPAGVVPDWATALMPQTVRLDFGLEGFDLIGAAKLALEDLAAGGTGDVPNPQMGAAMLPDGTMTLRLNPSRVTGADYALNANVMAQVDVEKNAPQALEAVISLSGMDAILTAMQQGPADVQQGAMGLMAMRGLAKGAPDGSLKWDIGLGEDGVPTVNGMSMGALGGMMP
ncbi:hypothetical protein SAMN05877809_103149 [Rhodobacter sp. JA431]|uniref:hypothetical protein n=1 Tax=Rhodobacter sp. JA431 TaxID=570013 RepID=UPI000BD69581|nr:hypothetical protein [Rhodobacter sp. JA431]SOC04182.1 hypothetical protein SAMN05877809_103149 [Rhodobacter sp. JA431]